MRPPAIGTYKRRRGAVCPKRSLARSNAKSSIMNNASNVNSQVMNPMCCSVTTVEGSNAILEVIERFWPRRVARFEQQPQTIAKERGFQK
jgi:hypothetical protein